MKKIISIAFAAILAGLAISCQKEEAISDKTDAVQYTFNIIVNDRAGFDSDASTKGSESRKYCWENGDRIFLFFKPAGDNLNNTYATLTYDGSEWGVNAPGLAGLGEDGTLSAVYVYNLDGNVYPEFSSADNQWTIATGNTFYNCETVTYAVSGNVISASLNLKAPTNFVRFYVEGATGALTCDKVKGWKDIAIGSDMTFSNVTCTGYMEGLTNSGDSKVKEYYGRIVSGTSLNGVECNFSVVKNGKVYERTTTPSSDAKSFTMNTSATDDKKWTVASGKLPGLFSVANGKLVRFSQGNMYWDGDSFEFESDQYSISSSWDPNHVSNFYWSKTASVAYAKSYDKSGTSASDVFFTNATGFTVDGQEDVWRTLFHDEWKYLFEHHTYNYVSVNGKHGIVIAPDGFSGTIAASYDATDWATAESNGFVFLPNTGFRNNGTGISETDKSCFYWTSTASGVNGDGNSTAYRMFFQWNGSTLIHDFGNAGERQWAVGIRLVTE